MERNIRVKTIVDGRVVGDMIVMAISDCLKEVTLVLSGDMPMNILLFGRMLMANFPKVTLFTISMELSMITALLI